MNRLHRLSALLLTLCLLIASLAGCNADPSSGETGAQVNLTLSGEESRTLRVGEGIQLSFSSATDPNEVSWSLSGDAVTVDRYGFVTALKPGNAVVTASIGDVRDSVKITVIGAAPEPDTGGDSTTKPDGGDDIPPKPDVELPDYTNENAFYRNYYPAVSREDALNRTQYGLMSGLLTVPDQEPTLAPNRPSEDGKFVRNNEPRYADNNNTYIVVDHTGEEVMRIYRGGAYITLEEVAAYVYAFGDVPANYVKDKDMSPDESIWGEYLRLNNTYFSGDTDRFPYEPVLPNISGCGGSLRYYEIDIGTTGTDCDPAYPVRIYNNGSKITRGAARIVYARQDGYSTITDPNERYVFYTYNHYNDFQEYLNYYGGWGEMFGNITGGGTISSTEDYNPTPYVPVIMASLGATPYEIVLEEYTVFDPVLLYCAAMPKKYAA